MKQGSGHSSDSGRKIEPRSHAINPGGVAQMGEMVGTAKSIEPMGAGRGFTAPKAGMEQHHSGSQGKHR